MIDTKRLRDLRERADSLIRDGKHNGKGHDPIEVAKLDTQMASAFPELLDEVDALREVAEAAQPCVDPQSVARDLAHRRLDAALKKLWEVRRG